MEAVSLSCNNTHTHTNTNINTIEALRQAKYGTNDLNSLVLEMYCFTRSNTWQIQSLTAKVGHKLVLSLCWTLTERRVCSDPWAYKAGSMKAVTVLNNRYKKIRGCEAKLLADNNNKNTTITRGWVPRSTFERTTFKFCVNDDKLANLLLELVTVLPLLVYGKTSKISLLCFLVEPMIILPLRHSKRGLCFC